MVVLMNGSLVEYVLKSKMFHGNVAAVHGLRQMLLDLEADAHVATGCWHVHRVFHRTRRLVGSEGIVESWVSEFKGLFDPVQGAASSTIIQRLQLRVAGIRGCLVGIQESNIVSVQHMYSCNAETTCEIAEKSIPRQYGTQSSMLHHLL